MKSFCLTDIGIQRNMNQDFVYASDQPVGKLPNLYIVADGMGGHKAGDVASQMAVLLLGRVRLGPRTEKFLKLIPYTAMSALVFPGVFSMDASRPWIGLAGVVVSAALAWRKCPVVVCVLAGIAVVFLLLL